MSAGYTPGPWLRSGLTIYTLRPCKWLGADSVENAWSALVMPDGQHKTPEQELEANARLIAAAPELVEALREVLEVCGRSRPGMDNVKRFVSATVKARALLARIEGGDA